MSNSTVSVVFIIKNGLKNGYCFWESLQSILPICDELIISDGYSDDGTYEALLKFKDKYKSVNINLYQDKWEEKSYHGEVIAKVTQRAIEKATKDYTLNLQGDELYHESTISYLKDIIKDKHYNSVSLPFYHFIKELRPSSGAYKEAIRVVRNGKKAKLKGDAWTFEPIEPVCPSNLCPKKVYHFAWIFPKNNDIKDIEHYKIYENYPCYKEKMQEALKNLKNEKKPYPMTEFNDFPELARRFIGEVEYKLPEDL